MVANKIVIMWINTYATTQIHLLLHIFHTHTHTYIHTHTYTHHDHGHKKKTEKRTLLAEDDKDRQKCPNITHLTGKAAHVSEIHGLHLSIPVPRVQLQNNVRVCNRDFNFHPSPFLLMRLWPLKGTPREDASWFEV